MVGGKRLCVQVIHVDARSDVTVFMFNAVILSLLIIFVLFLDAYRGFLQVSR